MCIISLVVLGTASGTVVVPILVEFVTSIKESLGARPGANEKGSALFTMAGAVGSILATVLGSTFYQVFGNQATADIFGCLSLLMAAIFFLANIWPAFLKTPPKPVAAPEPRPSTQRVKSNAINVGRSEPEPDESRDPA